MSHFQTLLLFISLHISFLPPILALADTLTQSQSLSDGQTLVSAGQIFELGFFTPGNSTNKYLGIWYYKLTPQTVVWVANREAPITGNNGGQLNISSFGDIVILDSAAGKTLWSSNSSVSTPRNSSLQLMDQGNLVLQDTDGITLWQSFDHPTDTFLPGMQVFLNETSGKARMFTSWRSLDDPSPGNFTMGLDPKGSAQIFIWDNGAPRWRSGQFNGKLFIGTKFRDLYIYGFTLTNDVSQGIMYYTYTATNSSLVKFVIQWDGYERTSMFVQDTRVWESVFRQPETACQIYAVCGKYGLCTDDAGNTPVCSCLDGFQPKNSQEWKSGNWSGGCVRRTPLANCANKTGNGFLRVPGLKVPDLSDWAGNAVGDSGCETACLGNCSCIAYAYVSGIGCMIWGQDLIDTYQFPSGGNDLYLKLEESELKNYIQGKRSNLRTALIAICVTCLFLLIVCALIFWKCRRRIKGSWNKWKRPDRMMFSGMSMSMSKELSTAFSGSIDCDNEGHKELTLYSFESIANATNDFCDSNKLGAGGFGLVYKGILPSGQEVAVKRLSKSSGQGLEEFKNEVLVIAKLQHRNLVRLLGCCIKGDEKILIYEYMPRNSLDALLFDPENKASLNWTTRFNIIEGIARGLLYLHRDSRLRIIHRDLKASNILLDAELNPKISDFGMARIMGGDDNQGNTMRLVGTFGYMAPEYAMEGLFSVKSDVYSFGILVLEIVTGQRNKSFDHEGNSMNIVGYAWKMWSEDKAFELIDQSIGMQCKMNEVLKCIRIGLLCVQDRADHRPDMASVVLLLGTESENLPVPERPTFTVSGRRHQTDELSYESFSANNYTITGVQAR